MRYNGGINIGKAMIRTSSRCKPFTESSRLMRDAEKEHMVNTSLSFILKLIVLKLIVGNDVVAHVTVLECWKTFTEAAFWRCEQRWYHGEYTSSLIFIKDDFFY